MPLGPINSVVTIISIHSAQQDTLQGGIVAQNYKDAGFICINC